MIRNSKEVLKFALIASFLWLSSCQCKAGEPCVYVDKQTWVRYVDPKVAPQYPPKSDSWRSPNSTLFVMIASFRDKLCPATLLNLFEKAKHPQRISVGLVQQNANEDVDCLDEYCRRSRELRNLKPSEDCPYRNNVRIMRVDATTAKGPTWARALGSTLLQEEEFCMQTDSHMDFVRNWDVKMLSMWADTGNEYAVLSTYVTSSAELSKMEEGQKGINGLHEVPHLCMVTFHGSNDMVRVWGTKCARSLPKPKLTNAIWGAGLSFSKCHAERKSPYDPHTPYIFDGEEFSRAIRFWTWGYDIYTPNRVYVVHDYEHSQSDPHHFDWTSNRFDPNKNPIEDSVFRLKSLWGMPPTDPNSSTTRAIQRSRYGLGDRRTLDQAIAFSGIDTKNRRSLGNRCGNLELVPFQEHPWGADYIPKYDSKTEEFVDVRDPGSIYFESSTMMDHWRNANKLRQQANLKTALEDDDKIMNRSVRSVPQVLGKENRKSGRSSNSPISHHSIDIDIRHAQASYSVGAMLFVVILIFVYLLCLGKRRTILNLKSKARALHSELSAPLEPNGRAYVGGGPTRGDGFLRGRREVV